MTSTKPTRAGAPAGNANAKKPRHGKHTTLRLSPDNAAYVAGQTGTATEVINQTIENYRILLNTGDHAIRAIFTERELDIIKALLSSVYISDVLSALNCGQSAIEEMEDVDMSEDARFSLTQKLNRLTELQNVALAARVEQMRK
jgi:hypothetical protein